MFMNINYDAPPLIRSQLDQLVVACLGFLRIPVSKEYRDLGGYFSPFRFLVSETKTHSRRRLASVFQAL